MKIIIQSQGYEKVKVMILSKKNQMCKLINKYILFPKNMTKLPFPFKILELYLYKFIATYIFINVHTYIDSFKLQKIIQEHGQDRLSLHYIPPPIPNAFRSRRCPPRPKIFRRRSGRSPRQGKLSTCIYHIYVPN